MSAAARVVQAPAGPALRDIHLPPAPAWWPPAPGWWILAALSILLAAGGLVWARRRQRRRQLLARVLGEVDRALAHYAAAGDVNQLAGALHQLLRRAARRLRPDAATQRGAAWRQTLASVSIDAATLECLLTLEAWMYRAPSAAVRFDAAASAEAVRRWLGLAWRRAGRR